MNRAGNNERPRRAEDSEVRCAMAYMEALANADIRFYRSDFTEQWDIIAQALKQKVED